MKPYEPLISEISRFHSTMPQARLTTEFTTDGATEGNNARLTIHLRVLMVPIPAQFAQPVQLPDAANPGKTRSARVFNVPNPNSPTGYGMVEVCDWNTSGDTLEFDKFKEVVKLQAESFWDNTELVLIGPAHYPGLWWPPGKNTHQLNVDCRFKFSYANGPGDADLTIYNTRISGAQDTFTLASSMGGGYGFLDSGDLVPGAIYSHAPGTAAPAVIGVSYTVPHEIGHAIGLPHIGVQTQHKPCLYAMSQQGGGGGNATQCYEGESPEDTANIMGMGWLSSVKNSLPWLYRAPQHTGTLLADWRVRKGKRPPRKRS